MRRRLSTTTALIASLSLAVPAPIFAQESLPNCADGSGAPCLPGMEPLGADGLPVPGTTMTDDEIAARKAAEAADQAAADKAAADQAAADQAAADKAAADQAAADKAAADQAAADQAAADQAAADKAAADQAAADQAAADKAAADQAAADKAAADKAAADQAAADKAAADKAAADQAAADQAAADKAAADQAAADQAATDKAAANQAAADQAAADKAAADQAAADKAAADQAAADQAAADKAAADKAAADQAGADQAAADKAAADQAAADKAAPAAGAEATPPVAEAVPVLPVQPDAASGEAPVAAAAAAADTAATDAAGTDAQPLPGTTVVEETVTKESVRSSSEDFATGVNQALTPEQAAAATAAAATGTTAAQPAATSATTKKDKGLTDFEKALLIGVGAVAVGAILSNNRKVAANSGDRVVVQQQDGSYAVIKDDDALLRQPGSTVRTERFADGSTRATVTRPDGSRIVTIRDAEYRVLRRVHIAPDGRQTLLIDDTTAYEPVVVSELPKPRKPREVNMDDQTALRLALAGQARGTGRAYSLAQIRDIDRVRELAPAIDLRAITFDTGSAAISPDQARALSTLGQVIEDFITENPREVFLVEGHTDAVGNAAYNLALSDRRAETVALALTEYFDIPPENLVVQGYGEEFLKVDTQAAERANRRATVRRITDLLRQASN